MQRSRIIQTPSLYLRYGSFDDLTSRKGDYTFIQGYRIGIGEAWSKTTGTGSTSSSNP